MKSQRNTSCNNMVSKLDTRLSKNAATWRRKPLVSAVLAGMIATLLPLSVSHTVSASELDVYEIGGAVPQVSSGGPVITLMLDAGGKMGRNSIGQAYSGQGDSQFDKEETEYPNAGCTPDLPKKGKPTNYGYVETRSVTINGETIEYKMYGCKATANADGVEVGDQLYDQISRVKNAVITLLANTDESKKDLLGYIANDVKVGLGRYSAEVDPSLPFGSGSSGHMLVPARFLTPQHRADIIRAMAVIRPVDEGPVPQALAEAGAYMLGSTTADRLHQQKIGYEVGGRVKRVANPNQDWETQFFMCDAVTTVEPTNHPDFNNVGLSRVARCHFGYPKTWGVNNYKELKNRVESPSDLPYTIGYGPLKDPDGHRNASYFFIKEGLLPDSPYSGFGLSMANTKKADLLTYESPLNVSSIINNNNQCGSKGVSGIYLLTSGYPTSPVKGGDGKYPTPKAYEEGTNLAATQVMNQSLSIIPGNNQVNCNVPGLINFYKKIIQFTGGDSVVREYPAWGCTGSYAKMLREEAGIVTAIAGMGPLFEGIPKNGDEYNCDGVEIPEEIRAGDETRQVITKLENHLQNKVSACKIAARGQGFGEGGFYPVRTSKEVADSIQNFIERLGGTEEYTPQQGDGLTVAADVTDATTSSNFAFLPLMLPRPGSKQLLWAGNVNKYKVKNGSLFDKNDKHIYDKVSGQIEPDTTELWNKSGSPDGGAVRTMVVKEKTYEPAGAYAQLTAPDSSKKDSIRTVYVEKGSGGIQKVEIKSNKPDGFDTLGYDFQKQQYLLNFLGYKVPVFANKKRITVDDYDGKDATSGEKNGVFKDKTNPMKDISDYAPAATDAIKILGGINNSKPQEVLYEKIYDTSTKNTTQTSAVLYGSTDGALHLVDGATGAEYFAFIPKGVMTSDRNIAAFKEDSTTLADGKDNETGKIAYGVDAPWYVDVLLNRKYETSKVTYTTDAIIKDGPVGHVRAYGGLGRGGIGFYGLNIKNKTSPEWLFGFDNTKSGFERLGNTWSKPTKSKIQFKEGAKTVNKEVLFLTGGYDLCYDNSDFKLETSNTEWKTKVDQKGDSCDSKSEALGNAVYMIDATNGDLLWTAKLEGTTPSTTELKDKTASKSTGNPYLKYSIPGEAAVIDTNYDGYVDSIYFADLGGQVFRADFAGEYTKDTGIKSKVTRILDTNDPNKADNVSLRLFQRPVVSAYRFDITKEKNKITDITTNSRGVKQTLIVSVASGDRNTPLSTLPERKASKNPNKIISVWNADKIEDTKTSEGVARLYKTGSGSDLLKLNFSSTSEEQLANKEKLIDGKIVKGWYDNLIYFKGETVQDEATKPRIQPRKDKEGNVLKDVIGENVSYLRSFGQPVIKGGRLFVSVYNNQVYMPAPEGTCSPVPTGVTEAHEYCLPFGTCEKNNSNGRGSIHTLGPGVASANFADIDHGSSQFALVTTTEIKKSGGGVTSGGTGGSKLVEDKGVFASLYDLLPNRWFERLPLLTGKSSDSTSSK